MTDRLKGRLFPCPFCSEEGCKVTHSRASLRLPIRRRTRYCENCEKSFRTVEVNWPRDIKDVPSLVRSLRFVARLLESFRDI